VRDIKQTRQHSTSSVTQHPSEIGRSSTIEPLIGGIDEPPPPPHRPKRKTWLWLVALVILGAAGWIALREHTKSSQAAAAKPKNPPPMPVVATVVHKGDIPVYLTGLGAVTPINTITLKSRVDGEIMNVFYKEGQVVQRDQSLVDIDSRPYEVQLTQAEGQLLKDQALLENAQTDLKRYATLIAKNAVSEQIYATQKSTVAQDEGAVKTDQGNIASAKLNIIYCHIKSPITGRAGLRLIDPGNLVQAASAAPLVVITQTEPISVIFTIGEDQVPQVLQHLKAGRRLAVQALDRDSKVALAQGELTTLDNQIDQTTGTLKLRAAFANKDENLFPNQFVNARLMVEEKRNVMLVSNEAIQRNGSSTFLYVVQTDNTVALRTVKVGAVGLDESEILPDSSPGNTVAPGEVVVTQGVDKLREGIRVQAQIQQTGKPAGKTVSESNANANNAHESSRRSGNSSSATPGEHPGANSRP
jgi:membrane fusion protein, multidrug efflux system